MCEYLINKQRNMVELSFIIIGFVIGKRTNNKCENPIMNI